MAKNRGMAHFGFNKFGVIIIIENVLNKIGLSVIYLNWV